MGAYRRAEVLATIAVASDQGMGHPPDLGLGATVLAVGIGRSLGLSAEVLADTWAVTLLRFSGCTSEAHLAAEAFGDEVKARGWMAGADFANPIDVLGRLIPKLGADLPPLQRMRAVSRAISKMAGLYDASQAHCEVAQALAERLGLSHLKPMLGDVFERWDGRGIPLKKRKDAIPMPVRLACLAGDIAIFHRSGGAPAAKEIAQTRSGSAFDPRAVAAFVANADALIASLDAPDLWVAALEAEPLPRAMFDEQALDVALGGIADFADLRSRFTLGHSRKVSALAAKAAAVHGLDAAAQKAVERAGLLHDLGRASISAGIWDKPGALTSPEWEQVRLHTYLTERSLSRAGGLGDAARVASLAHERLNGKGYHKALPGSVLDKQARLLAAADVFVALTETRPHRAARSGEEAAKVLFSEAEAGALCPDASAAVAKAAGEAVPRRELPFGLSERELDVLRLLARGQSNKEIAVSLQISPKTAGHHVQHIFEKLGVSTRAAATYRAIEKGVL
jgi:HD-GYP domain-containing protein (c-di-GMP phosphodiesterase class II)/DNA-binding CsgD family transcriptional regulator